MNFKKTSFDNNCGQCATKLKKLSYKIFHRNPILLDFIDLSPILWNVMVCMLIERQQTNCQGNLEKTEFIGSTAGC